LGGLAALCEGAARTLRHVGGAGLQLPEVATTVKLHEASAWSRYGLTPNQGAARGYFIIDVPDLDTALDWGCALVAPAA